MNCSHVKTAVVVRVRSDLDKQSQAEVSVAPLNGGQRLFLAVKYLAAAWAGAFVCLFIPLAHFVLVPAGIIIGVVLFYQKFSLHNLFLSGQIVCPKCNQSFEPKPEPFNWPKRLSCPSCGIELIVNAEG